MTAFPADELDDSDAPVWYVSYGSHMSRARFERALRGTPPRADVAVVLPGRVWFAGEVPDWAGDGIAFYDHEAPGTAPARAYLITAGQFTDVRTAEGPRYARLVHLGARDDVPMMTFTAPHGIGAVPHARPPERYLDTLRTALHEAHGWDHLTISAYFARVLPPPAAAPATPARESRPATPSLPAQPTAADQDPVIRPVVGW